MNGMLVYIVLACLAAAIVNRTAVVLYMPMWQTRWRYRLAQVTICQPGRPVSQTSIRQVEQLLLAILDGVVNHSIQMHSSVYRNKCEHVLQLHLLHICNLLPLGCIFSMKTNSPKVIRRQQRLEMIIFWHWSLLMQLYASSLSRTNQN